MIIGNGDIAKILKPIDTNSLIFFASGVSNSKETRGSEFRREKDLLFDFYNTALEEQKRLVYFGSLSIFYNKNEYAQHKKRMEQYVKMFPNWTIIRIGNITFGTNPHTIINSMRNQLARGENLEIQDTFRYMVDENELLYWISMIPDWNAEMNITGKRMSINEIVEKYVNDNGR